MVCGVDLSSWVPVSVLWLQLRLCERVAAAGERHGPRLNVPSPATGEIENERGKHGERSLGGENSGMSCFSVISLPGEEAICRFGRRYCSIPAKAGVELSAVFFFVTSGAERAENAGLKLCSKAGKAPRGRN